MYGNYHKPYLFMACYEKPNFHYESVVGWFFVGFSGFGWFKPSLGVVFLDVVWVFVGNFR